MKQNNLKASLRRLPAPKPTRAQFEQALPLNLQIVSAGGFHLAWRTMEASWFKKSILVGVTITALTVGLLGTHFYFQQAEDDLTALDELSLASMLLI